MNLVTKFAATAAAALVVATAAQAGGIVRPDTVIINGNGPVLQLAKIAGCSVAGSPSEFPNDVWIVNKGVGKLTAGTKVNWSIPGYGNAYKGTHTLVAALNPGQGVHLLNVLPNGVEAGHDCLAKAI